MPGSATLLHVLGFSGAKLSARAQPLGRPGWASPGRKGHTAPLRQAPAGLLGYWSRTRLGGRGSGPRPDAPERGLVMYS